MPLLERAPVRHSQQKNQSYRTVTVFFIALLLCVTNSRLVLCCHPDGTSALGSEDFLSCCADHADTRPTAPTMNPTLSIAPHALSHGVSFPLNPEKSASYGLPTTDDHSCIDFLLDSATHRVPSYSTSIPVLGLVFLSDATVHLESATIPLPSYCRGNSPPRAHMLPLLI